MAEIPVQLKQIFDELGIKPSDAAWEVRPDTGVMAVKHKALERVAAHKKITFEPPVMIEANAETKTVVMLVTGRLGEQVEWSIGEAAPYNNKNAYPFAMAEKRAKDRVILKLINVAGDVYSEEEADDFKQSRPDVPKQEPQAKPKEEPQAKPTPKLEEPPFDDNLWRQFVDEQKRLIDRAQTKIKLTSLQRRTRDERAQLQEVDRELYAELMDHWNNRFETLNTGER